MSSTTDRDLGWLLEHLLADTPGSRHALVLSADGLKLCHSAELSADQADQLAAIASGIQSLSYGASIEFGDGTGGVRQSMTEFHGGILCIVDAGRGAHLALVTDESADVGLVGHNMHGLVEQIGAFLSSPPRESADAGTDVDADVDAGTDVDVDAGEGADEARAEGGTGTLSTA